MDRFRRPLRLRFALHATATVLAAASSTAWLYRYVAWTQPGTNLRRAPNRGGRGSAVSREPRSARQRNRGGPRRTIPPQEHLEDPSRDPYSGNLWQEPRRIFSDSVEEESRHTNSDSAWEEQGEEDDKNIAGLPPARSWRDMYVKEGTWQTFTPKDQINRPTRRLKDTHELGSLLRQIKSHVKDWPATGVAMALVRLGKVAGPAAQRDVQEVLSQLVEATLNFRLSEMRTRDLARFIEAWGLLRHTPKGRLMERMCNTLEQRLKFSRDASEASSNDLNSAGITGAILGMSLAGFKHEGLLSIMCETVPDRLFEFSSSEISKMLYSFARLEYRHRQYLLAMGDHVPYRLKEFTAQEISTSVYAMWLLKFRHRKFLTGVCDHLPERLPEFNVHSLCNTAYALGKLEFKHRKFTAALSTHVASRVKDLNKEKMVANMLRSLQTLQSL
mmetsp:Transcript_88904/g.176847  ORF Transcript_88904/g.176847 Transcript_88904/m.176847 type:complete len:444 (-) Transcript_88904:8-1339(-)